MFHSNVFLEMARNWWRKEDNLVCTSRDDNEEDLAKGIWCRFRKVYIISFDFVRTVYGGTSHMALAMCGGLC